ncbi:MAG TPA: DUF2933 domain-containing protein [Jatrophihabitans sp.]|nr:DUF2933 domain-containing protein [Jatrophihabitans sp.]
MTNGKHLKYMLLIGGGLFAVLLVAGVPLSAALSYALLLACPLMMVWMMLSMPSHDGSEHSGHEPDSETRSGRGASNTHEAL